MDGYTTAELVVEVIDNGEVRFTLGEDVYQMPALDAYRLASRIAGAAMVVIANSGEPNDSPF